MKERAFPFVLADPPSFISHSLASANVMVNSPCMLTQPAELHQAGCLAAAGVSGVGLSAAKRINLPRRAGGHDQMRCFYGAPTFCIACHTHTRSYTAEAAANPVQRELKIGHV